MQKKPTIAVYMKWPEVLINEVKKEANGLSISYQSFIKMAVSEFLNYKKKNKGN